MWWHTSVILGPKELRQGDCEFEASVGKLAGSCLEKKREGKRKKKNQDKREKDKTEGETAGQYWLSHLLPWKVEQRDEGQIPEGRGQWLKSIIMTPYKVSLAYQGKGCPDVLTSFMSAWHKLILNRENAPTRLACGKVCAAEGPAHCWWCHPWAGVLSVMGRYND